MEIASLSDSIMGRFPFWEYLNIVIYFLIFLYLFKLGIYLFLIFMVFDAYLRQNLTNTNKKIAEHMQTASKKCASPIF